MVTIFDVLKKRIPPLQKVVVFSGSSYQFLFFSLFIQRFKKNVSCSFQTIDISSDTSQIMSQLNMSFLGNELFYWLGNVDNLDARQKKQWFTFLSEYTGPHHLFCFTKDAQKLSALEHVSLVHVTEELDKILYKKLVSRLYPDIDITGLFIKDIFTKHPKIALEKACILMQYQKVLGRRTKDFTGAWLNKIIAPDTSLFQLSQFFFARKARRFLQLWYAIKGEYPMPFWTVFWSEQLWRVYYYISFQKRKNIVDAKKISYRLPFSLIQRDWRSLSLDTIRSSHERIVHIDFQLKNNGSDFLLDCFYFDFFKSSL